MAIPDLTDGRVRRQSNMGIMRIASQASVERTDAVAGSLGFYSPMAKDRSASSTSHGKNTIMQRIAWTITLFGFLIGVGMAQAAPRQLLNKTIAFSYNVASVQRDPDGRTRNINTAINYLWFVSNAGRVFERSSRTTSTGGRSAGDFAPNAQVKGAGARDVHFEGDKLVSLRSFEAGASRTVVSFDPSFTTCTISVQQGKEGGVFKRKMTDGVVREVLSISTSGETCSVREGNPFAN